jgi:hypothetical protein
MWRGSGSKRARCRSARAYGHRQDDEDLGLRLAVHQHRARPDIDPVRDTIAVAALDTGISPIVRVPFMQHTMATRVLDAGALVTASARRDLQHAAPE